MKGYTGKIIMLDLTKGKSEVIEIPDKVYENFLSGMGLATYVMTKYIPKGSDPLGPDNVLGLVSGLLTGTGSFMTGRWLAVGKSPLTGGWGDANCGGTFAPAIKRCGFDGLFFKGISASPVYVEITNKGAQIKDASAYWGLDTCEAEEQLIKDCRIKKKPEVALIGPAGEKLSLISGITNDFGRIAARSGLGAVMGSKKLKAVVCHGTKKISCVDQKGMFAESKAFAEKVKKQNLPIAMGHIFPYIGKVMSKMKNVLPLDGIMLVALLKKFGTGMNNTLAIYNGDAPIKNWKGTPKDFKVSKSKEMSPLVMNKTEYKKYHCYSCIVGCGGICDIKDASKGRFSHTHKPEYETVNAFGPLLLNKDHKSILYINELLNRAGMDSISAGAVIAYAIECYQNGVITIEDTNGIELDWGNSDSIIKMVKLLIERKGIGDLFADGVKKASERIVANTSDYALHCGGQEPAMHDTRMDPILAVHYSADPTPGKHTIGASIYYNTMKLWEYCSWAPPVTKHSKESEYIPSEEEALKSMAMSCYKMILDGAGGCYYAMLVGNQHWNVVSLLNHATGWEKSYDEYMNIGKRIHTARQMFNIREGINPKDNIIGERMSGKPALQSGPLKGKSVDIQEMVRLHWEKFGWNPETGIPETETLIQLGLMELFDL